MLNKPYILSRAAGRSPTSCLLLTLFFARIIENTNRIFRSNKVERSSAIIFFDSTTPRLRLFPAVQPWMTQTHLSLAPKCNFIGSAAFFNRACRGTLIILGYRLAHSRVLILIRKYWYSRVKIWKSKLYKKFHHLGYSIFSDDMRSVLPCVFDCQFYEKIKKLQNLRKWSIWSKLVHFEKRIVWLNIRTSR